MKKTNTTNQNVKQQPKYTSKATIKNPKLDKRRKLTILQREEISKNIRNLTIKELALLYGVSYRTVEFILFPEKKRENDMRMQERGGWKQYYNKDKNKQATKKYYQRKKELIDQGLI